MGKRIQNRILECYMCHLIVKKKVSNLRRHMKLHGPFVQCFKCLECNATFQNKNNWKNHCTKKHTNAFDDNVAPKMMVTSRPAKLLRQVGLIGSFKLGTTPKPKKQNNDVAGKFVVKVESPLFGDTSALDSKEFDPSLNSFRSVFDHTGFGSHLPSPHKITEQLNSAKSKQLSSTLPQMSQLLYSNRKTTLDLNVPDILRAVGLAKLVHPKCYSNKKKIVHLPKAEVTLSGIVFGPSGHFGKLD